MLTENLAEELLRNRVLQGIEHSTCGNRRLEVKKKGNIIVHIYKNITPTTLLEAHDTVIHTFLSFSSIISHIVMTFQKC